MASVLRIAPTEPDERTNDDTLATGELRLRRCPTCGEEYPDDYRVCPRDATPLGFDRESRDPLLGVVLAGTYRLSRPLGRGGMGRLYEAEHARLDRRFAVKVLHESCSQSRDAVARFEREARALGRIRSDHVLDVVDVVRAPDGRTAIVTARLEGEDLKARLDRVGKLSLGEAISVARQICRGLAAAHAQGVVHRDLKPSNIFLETGADGRVTVKILDFGVAKLVGEPELTRTGAVVGTPAFMAPEQARGSARVDERADVYAVGAVLYRMLTGRAPYSGEDAATLLSRLLHEAPQRPRAINRAIPAGLEAVIQRAMARDPNARPSNALELERELAAFDPGDVEPTRTLEAPLDPTVDTMVLPRGSVARAEAIARRARRARPLAVVLALSATLASAAVAVLAAAGATTLDGPEHTPVDRTLIWLSGGTAMIAVATLLSRWIGSRWEQVPEVSEANRTLALALLAATASFGTFELGSLALQLLQAEAEPLAGGALLARALVPPLAATVTLVPDFIRRARELRA